VIYDLGSPGRNVSTLLPACDVPETEIPAELMRENLDLPEVSELDVVRHFVKLSQLNYAIDTGFYPLGSCTMKYNPKIDEGTARTARTRPRLRWRALAWSNCRPTRTAT